MSTLFDVVVNGEPKQLLRNRGHAEELAQKFRDAGYGSVEIKPMISADEQDKLRRACLALIYLTEGEYRCLWHHPTCDALLSDDRGCTCGKRKYEGAIEAIRMALLDT